MKNKMFRYLKVLSGIIIFLSIIFVIALLWPTPKFESPGEHSTVFIKSINIIGIKSGNILRDRDILIKDNIIEATDTIGFLEIRPSSLRVDCKNKFVIRGLCDRHTQCRELSISFIIPLISPMKSSEQKTCQAHSVQGTVC